MTETLPDLPSMPAELYAHLTSMDSRSFEFGQEFAALNQLAQETGHATLTLEQIFPPNEVVPPEGFKSELIIPSGAELRADQFKGVIHSLASTEKVLKVDVHRLVTDSGLPVSYCDLRPFMTNSVQKGGPQERAEVKTLDGAFVRDLKVLVESGRPRNDVTSVPGVHYTKLGKSKIRAYWMNVKGAEPTEGPLIARIADCGNSVASEQAVYRRVFGPRF